MLASKYANIWHCIEDSAFYYVTMQAFVFFDDACKAIIAFTTYKTEIN